GLRVLVRRKLFGQRIEVTVFLFRNFIDLGLFLLRFGLATVKEFVAGGPETFPDLIGILIGHAANGFPFFLQLNKLLFGGIPVGAVFYGFGLFAEFGFKPQVLHFLFV